MAIDKLIEGYKRKKYEEYMEEVIEKLEKYDYKLYRYIPIKELDKNITKNLLNKEQFGFQSILNNYIYHNKPSFFNDPYDCVFGIGLNAFFRELLGYFIEIKDINKVFSIENQYHSFDELIAVVNELEIADEIKEYIVFIFKEIEQLMKEPNFNINDAMQKFTVKMLNSPVQYMKFLKPFIGQKIDEVQLTNQMKMLSDQVGIDKLSTSGLNPINPKFDDFKDLIISAGFTGDAQKMEDKLNDSINDFNNKIFGFIDEKFGVASLTTSYNNPLMWSHYAASHKGICIEYDFKDIIRNKDDVKIFLDEVIYSDQRVTIDSNLMDKVDLKDIESKGKIDLFKLFIEGLFNKHKVWEYETEWRSIVIVDEQKNFNRELRLNNISGIYLGNKMNDATVNVVITLLADLNVPIYKMVNEISDYTMKPVRIR
ncbi:MAG: DUF2971 domain-containing protein [Acholeplasmataceae bacterium]|nr:DUF2971 domain-containing protein [Acholeplasmataceae bacterium]